MMSQSLCSATLSVSKLPHDPKELCNSFRTEFLGGGGRRFAEATGTFSMVGGAVLQTLVLSIFFPVLV